VCSDARDQRPDDESPFEQKRSEVTACDQRPEVPFDSRGQITIRN